MLPSQGVVMPMTPVKEGFGRSVLAVLDGIPFR